jgi:hypothetical protein
MGNRRQEKERQTLGDTDRWYQMQYGEWKTPQAEKKDFLVEIPVRIL